MLICKTSFVVFWGLDKILGHLFTWQFQDISLWYDHDSRDSNLWLGCYACLQVLSSSNKNAACPLLVSRSPMETYYEALFFFWFLTCRVFIHTSRVSFNTLSWKRIPKRDLSPFALKFVDFCCHHFSSQLHSGINDHIAVAGKWGPRIESIYFLLNMVTRWWFQIFFVGENDPIWLIFFRGVETTN